MSVTQLQIMPPVKVSSLIHSQWAVQVLKTALELDIFSTLKQKKHKADELAQALKTDARATKLILDALCSLEFVREDRGAYECTEMAQTYLSKDSDFYLGKYIFMREVLHQAWQNLTDTVRTGKPQARVNTQEEGEKFFHELTEAIFPLNFCTAQALCEQLGIPSKKNAVKVLDLAAGSAVWSLPMAKSNKNVHVDALDFKGVIEVTKKFATRFGVADQYGYLPGDWRQIQLEPESYDYIILGHILHSEGKDAAVELLKYCAKALKKDGTLIIAEFMENEDRKGPVFATLFAINMMLATASGCVFTAHELKDMLKSVGLPNAQRQMMPGWGEESPILVASK